MTKVLAVLSALALALLAAQVARADADFTDPSGDANGAPDVTNITVFNDAFNRVVLGAKIAGTAAIAADSDIAFILDTDDNGDTGNNGWDYLVVIDGSKEWGLYSWDGTQWVEAPSTTAKVYFLDAVVLFAIDRSELGNTARFNFFAEATKYAGEEVVATDSAPDGDAIWSYATVTKTYGLTASPIIAVTKGGARVGKPFVAGYLASRTDSPEPMVGPKTTCVATVGTKRIAARTTQDGDVAICRVTVPKLASKGKVLKLTLTTTAGGKTVKKSYSTKIRA